MSRSRSLRSYLLALVLVGLIPAALFGGGLMVLLWNQQQEELRQALQETARAMSLAVDRELESTIKRLTLLSNSDALLADRLEAFDREARRQVAISGDWINLLVLDARGDQRVNINRPFGAALPRLDALEYYREVARTKRPVVSGVFVSPVTGNWVVHVAVPVLGPEAEVQRVLVASLHLAEFDQILRQQSVPRGGVASILDQDERFVARSQASERFRGQRPIDPLLGAIRQADKGNGKFPRLDGPSTYTAWHKSENSGWTVTFGILAAPAEDSLRSSLLMLLAIGAGVLLGAGALAYELRRRIVGPMVAATDGALALAKGEVPGAIRSDITEVQALSAGLVQAGRLLQAESKERERAQREREELFEREQAARCEAEAASRAKDEFLAMLGHELRNPLAPIVTATELMKLRGDDASTRERVIIERQAKHLTQLVDDLLDVSRIARGKVSLKKEQVSIDDVIAKSVEMVSPILEQKNHRLEVQTPDHGQWLAGDPTRLAQIFANLLTNAAKFTDPGGRISIIATREGDQIVVRIKDTGAGMPPELLPRVFDLFTQGRRDVTPGEGGLGLGLALVRSFVERHGGSVAAYSEGRGKGSEFTVRLPALPLDGTVPVETRAASLPANGGRVCRVLVVDDNQDAAAMLADLIRGAGHDVRTAKDAVEALAMVGAFRPDIAVVDIGLPVMDGYELAQHLRVDLEHPPYLIALTGYGAQQDRERSRAAGFVRHLVKPVAAEEVLEAVGAGVREAMETLEAPQSDTSESV